MRSSVMDYLNVPACALFRQTGTVIIRLKMDVTSDCCRPQVCHKSEYTKVVHRSSACEQCSRTRSNSKFCDCDTCIVDRYRPYRTSVIRRRYVSVCATVCLLLLVGGLSPQSSAAPHWRRTMDRQRRSSGSQENSLWANPCDYDTSYSKSVKYEPKLAKDVASQARNALKLTEKYKDTFASELHSYSSFEELLKSWSTYDWLRNSSWYQELILPKEKILNHPVPDEHLNNLMNHINEVLPVMYKSLKLVVAGLNAVHSEALDDSVISDGTLKNQIRSSMHDVRAVLCLFSDIMRARNLKIMPLTNEEIPNLREQSVSDKLAVSLLIYRDTLNYLEYLAQVFQKMYETEA